MKSHRNGPAISLDPEEVLYRSAPWRIVEGLRRLGYRNCDIAVFASVTERSIDNWRRADFKPLSHNVWILRSSIREQLSTFELRELVDYLLESMS